MKDYIQLLRPHQYIKNLFIFAPILFYLGKVEFIAYEKVFFTFILFSIIASSIYIFNDINDIHEDRKHPSKKYRPIASKKISIQNAKKLFYLLAVVGLGFSFLLDTKLFFIFVLYFLLNIFYTKKLKHISIIDIFIIATGFVLRLFAGSVVSDIALSKWIIIMTFLLAIFLALAKRRDDVMLALKGEKTRKNIDGYNLEFINSSMVLMSGVVIVSYILYTVSEDVVAKLHTKNLYLTSFFVILGILRYMQITFVEQKSGSPTKIVLKDRFLQLTIFFWLISFFVVIMFL